MFIMDNKYEKKNQKKLNIYFYLQQLISMGNVSKLPIYENIFPESNFSLFRLSKKIGTHHLW